LKDQEHKSGFVNIVGRPNVGKSTLMNGLVGERMSIITAKPQTTRHRIIGIVSGDDFQIVFSDTPGYINDPKYEMHNSMNSFVGMSFEDGDILIFVTDFEEKFPDDDPLLRYISNSTVPKLLVLNKVDTRSDEEILNKLKEWQERIPFDECVPISALKGRNLDRLVKLIRNYLPKGLAYYPKDQLTDKSERFFVGEIIREKILELYHQEVPYSVEVMIENFRKKDSRQGPMIHIEGIIYVNRKTQKSILIGKGGQSIKKLGMESRKAIEKFINQKVFLELFVKVRENWRDDKHQLRRFGYHQ
jgi:GTP-binding protein Era